MAANRYLVDTNVLLTATQPQREHFKKAKHILDNWSAAGRQLCVSGQILREYFAVATRPMVSNGLGLEPAEAAQNVEAFCRRMVFLEEDDRVSALLRELVVALTIRGKQVHDANLVATATVHRVDLLVTANVSDFERFAGWITTLDLGLIPHVEVSGSELGAVPPR